MSNFQFAQKVKKNLNQINITKLVLELLVVFLGVTAGFLLQNQKEDAQNDDLEQKYLDGFYSDVSKNVAELDSLIIKDSLWVMDNNYALNQMAGDSLSIDSANSLIKEILQYEEFTKQTTTYENIINSSNLNIIKDYELKLQIVDYHKSLSDFKLLEHYLKEFHNNLLIPYVIENYDMFTESLSKPELRKTIVLKNIIGVYYSLVYQRWNGYKDLRSESVKLQAALDPYVENSGKIK